MTREDVGRGTWTLLHTMAAAFPEKPSKAQQRDAAEFVRGGGEESHRRIIWIRVPYIIKPYLLTIV